MRDDPRVAGLPMGRPANRKRVYRGDRRGLVADPANGLMGPDAHGVYWRPVREYYAPTPDETLVVFAPIHPDDLPAGVL